MQKDILVPLDGSPLGERALTLGIALASRTGGALHLVHVRSPRHPIYVEGLPVLDEEGRETHRLHEEAYLEALASRITDEDGLPVRTAIVEGNPATALAGYASEEAVGLLVMTTHGYGGLTRAWLGSVADTLVRCSPVPLLLLRATEEEASSAERWSPERLLVLLDGSALAEQILNPVEYLARLMGAQCILLAVAQPPIPLSSISPYGGYIREMSGEAPDRAAREYLERIAMRLDAAGISTTTRVIVSEQVAPRILDAVGELNADMIAMTTRGHSGLRRLLLGSVADKVLRGADVPLLLCTPNMPAADEPQSRDRSPGF